MGQRYRIPDPDAPGQTILVEQQPDGSVVEVVGASVPNNVINPNPVRAAQERAKTDREERNANRADRRENRMADSADVANDLKRVELDLKREQLEREGNTAKQLTEWRGNLNNIGLLEERVGKLRQMYNEHFKGKGLQSIAEAYAPRGIAPQYAVFDDTGQQMLADMAKAKGLTAQQFNTPAEQRMFFEPLIPKRGDTDEQILNKLDYLERMIQTGKQTTLQNLGEDAAAGKAQQQADNEVPDPTTGGDLKPPPADGSPPELPPENGGDVSLPEGGLQVTQDPRLAAQLRTRIAARQPLGKINEWLTGQGGTPIDSATYLGAISAVKAGKPFRVEATRTKPLSGFQSLLADPRIAPFAAGGAHYFNNATAGLAGNLAGDDAQGTLDAAAALNPGAAMFGGLAGGVTGALGAEAAAGAQLAKLGVKAAGYAPRVGDALYGAALGGNTAQEGEGLQGAALGAGLGALGGFVGQKAMSGLGRATRGVVDPSVQILRDANIPLTVGGVMGGGVKKVQDALTSLPFVGNMVENRQREGVEALAARMANDAVAPIGGIAPDGYGQQAADNLLQQGSDAYTAATSGVTVPLDDQFGVDIAQARALGQLLPDDHVAKFNKALDNRVNPIIADDYLTGDTFQQGMRGLRAYRAKATEPGFEQEYRNAITGGMNALKGQMNRGGGQQVVDDLAKADEAWKGIKIYEKAVNAARNGARSGEVGLPMPSHFNDAAAAAAQRYGGPRFNGELIDAAQRVLPSKLPDSGTWTRAIVGGGGLTGVGGSAYLGGPDQAATGTGLGALLMGALALGGTKGAQKVLVNALTQRSPAAIRVGNNLVANQRHGGWTGAGLLAPLIVGQ